MSKVDDLTEVWRKSEVHHSVHLVKVQYNVGGYIDTINRIATASLFLHPKICVYK